MFGRELLCHDSAGFLNQFLLTFVPASFVLKLTHGNALPTSEFLSPVRVTDRERQEATRAGQDHNAVVTTQPLLKARVSTLIDGRKPK
ncbi:Carbamoyl-phosphate synthase small chain [Frankliniella fusca]|uniref:Carbamoyl-phosphate synthase small chain n=1 Tax=Frankliniella fusca TaxID=407009 RepID=A0AAE1L8S2_9NEOP|nr:Carbamoyl-phosphate synthase small chain [Frankliniella fusca]